MLKLFDEFDLEINKVKLNDDLRVYSDDTGGGSGGPACSQSDCCPTMQNCPTMSTCSCVTCIKCFTK